MIIDVTRLSVSPFVVESIVEMKVEQSLNQHASMYLKGIIPKESGDSGVMDTDDSTVITVSDQDGVIFSGLVQDIRASFEGQVYYLEVINRKIHLHTEQESLPFYGKLEELEPSLPETFFRCHRSFIVNFDHVQRYDKKDVWLLNGEQIPLSKRRYQSFGLEFMHYLKEIGDVF